jgi:hypothetical protein
MDETLLSVEVSVSGKEGSDSHLTLERHDISGLYPISSMVDVISKLTIRRAAT